MLQESQMGESNFRVLSASEIEFVSGGNLHINGDGVDPLLLTTVGYDPTIDYCGSGWTGPFVPDAIDGIDIGLACYVHDQNYSSDSTMDRKDADEAFADHVYALLRLGGMEQEDAAHWAAVYATAVAFAGEEHYDGQGEGSYDPSQLGQ